MLRRLLFAVSAVAAALLFAPRVRAQRFSFKFYGEEEGLKNLAVQTVLQDRSGFLWAGTQNGLFRYDGNQFTAYGKNEGLPGTRVESLYEAADGTLWVATDGGLARRVLDRSRQDRFQAIQVPGFPARQGISSDRNGRLYLGTGRGFVVGRPGKNGLIFDIVPMPPWVNSQEVSSVFTDAAGVVWFGCGYRLCRYENGAAREVGAAAGLPLDRWDAILGDLDGNLWVRSASALYVRRSESPRFEPVTGVPASKNTFPTLALDPAGKLLVPTYKGLARQTAAGWEIVGSDQGLTTNDISAVIQDREGSIWLGLLGSGLAGWRAGSAMESGKAGAFAKDSAANLYGRLRGMRPGGYGSGRSSD
jgi:ligand-binding sensor domain-containing protein